jgi:tripartite-type tricarboxylate transporter receptor subunit TctC
MLKRQRFLITSSLLALAMLLGYPAISAAQSYPTRPIRIIVPFGAGGGTDVVARAMGDELAKLAHVPVIVDNIAGANGILGTQTASRAAPDGYTILMVTGTTHAANLAMYKKLPYDPVKDFEPIIKTAEAPLVLVVHPDSPYRTVAEFVAAVKARKQLSFAGSSAATRIAGEMLKSQLNGDLLHVPYKSSQQALNDLMGKQFDFMVVDTGPVMPLIKGGRLRPLAVSSSRRDGQLPAVPTFTEVGLKDFVLITWGGVVAPAGTPAKIVEQLNGWLRQVMQVQAVRDRMLQTGVAPVSTTSQEFRSFIKSEISFWTQAVKEAGIEPE